MRRFCTAVQAATAIIFITVPPTACQLRTFTVSPSAAAATAVTAAAAEARKSAIINGAYDSSDQFVASISPTSTVQRQQQQLGQQESVVEHEEDPRPLWWPRISENYASTSFFGDDKKTTTESVIEYLDRIRQTGADRPPSGLAVTLDHDEEEIKLSSTESVLALLNHLRQQHRDHDQSEAIAHVADEQVVTDSDSVGFAEDHTKDGDVTTHVVRNILVTDSIAANDVAEGEVIEDDVEAVGLVNEDRVVTNSAGADDFVVTATEANAISLTTDSSTFVTQKVTTVRDKSDYIEAPSSSIPTLTTSTTTRTTTTMKSTSTTMTTTTTTTITTATMTTTTTTTTTTTIEQPQSSTNSPHHIQDATFPASEVASNVNDLMSNGSLTNISITEDLGGGVESGTNKSVDGFNDISDAMKNLTNFNNTSKVMNSSSSSTPMVIFSSITVSLLALVALALLCRHRGVFRKKHMYATSGDCATSGAFGVAPAVISTPSFIRPGPPVILGHEVVGGDSSNAKIKVQRVTEL